jgi:very-short-patch-repair endonuclease
MTNHRRPPMATRSLERARELRGGSTDAERKLWSVLRGGNIDGLKFRRQHPIPPYTVDFCCLSADLVVEVDGSQHSEESDRARTRFLESKGFTVLRFWDNDVLMQIEAVVEAICRTVSPSPLTPTPLPSGEGL